MIDLKQLRENPDRFRDGARKKGIMVDLDQILSLDSQYREKLVAAENIRAQQARKEKEVGPQIGALKAKIAKTSGQEQGQLMGQLQELIQKPAQLKGEYMAAMAPVADLQFQRDQLLLQVPLPPDPDVPVGSSSKDNVEIRRWNPTWFDTSRSFEQNKGFKAKSHMELLRDLNLCDFERGVKIAGSRSYVLSGMGMRLHQAVLRYAFDYMVEKHGFAPRSVPSLTREETMVGTGFFPAGREQAYHIEESKRGGGYDLFLAGTGEVGLMGLHMGEILDEAALPLKYVTVSPCFRREAGAAGKDTAGLYRIHQFEKVEQVVICRADEQESRRWHKQMIGFVEELLQSLELPYRLLQCCTGDLGVKNADMVDIECWMPGREASGAYGETHSASRLYDFQCRRLNMRYRPGGEAGKGETTFCHSLNNTVIASPRVLIPILEMYQNKDGSVTVPRVLREYIGGAERIG